MSAAGSIRAKVQIYCVHFTGPSSSSLVLVSSVSGVDAKSQTPPSRILIAVDRPPNGTTPNRENGLKKPSLLVLAIELTIYSPRECPNTRRNLCTTATNASFLSMRYICFKAVETHLADGALSVYTCCTHYRVMYVKALVDGG